MKKKIRYFVKVTDLLDEIPGIMKMEIYTWISAESSYHIPSSIGPSSDNAYLEVIGKDENEVRRRSNILENHNLRIKKISEEQYNINKVINNIRRYFEELRFDENHHLGLGDIRLTIKQQNEILEMLDELIKGEKI